MVRSIGADQVIDYTREDFATGGRRYDLILDIGDRSLSDCRRALTPKETLVVIGGSAGRWIDGLGRSYKARCLPPLVRQRLRPFLIRKSMVRGQAVAPGAAQRSRVQAGRWVPARRRVPG